MKLKRLLLLLTALLPPLSLFAQSPVTNRVVMLSNNPGAPLDSWIVTNSIPATNEISFNEFLNEVAAANLDYAAQRYNVDIAKAAVAIAKEFPNPTLALNGDRDLTFHNKYGVGTDGNPALLRQVESRGVGITQTIEYFGKRKWRIRTADHAYRAAAATLEDFARNLKLDASAAFAETLATQRTLEQQRKAANYLNQLVAAQRHRLTAGDIGETDLTQSRVDELQSENDLLNAQNDAQTAQLALNTFLGRNRGQTIFTLRGKLELEPRTFDISQLIASALQNRADLIAMRHTRDGAQSGVSLAKASRLPDVDVGVGYTHNGGVALNHPVDPTPAFDQLSLSFSFPLPLWNRNKAEIASAHFAAEQSQKQLESAELKAEVQVRQAFNTYQLMQERVQKFQGELLKGADDVLTAKRFSYEHGQTTLLDLLDAQRADNNIHQSYNDALADDAKALIELERAVGLWDIAF